jgi:hypothetical protein
MVFEGNTAAALRSSSSFRVFSLSGSPREDSSLDKSRDRDMDNEVGEAMLRFSFLKSWPGCR